jgi:DNA-binding transcriptional LysR family regulator
VVTAADHPLASRTIISFEETLEHDHIALSMNASINTMIQRIAAEKGRELRYRLHVSTFDAAYRLIQANLALGLIPAEVVTRYTKLYNLRVIPLSDTWARRGFIICIRGHDTLSVPARLLLTQLLADAAGMDAAA